MTTHRLPVGLNDPVEEFPSGFKQYGQCCDGKLVYIDPNGSIEGIVSGTKLRHLPIIEIFETIQNTQFPQGFTHIFVVTNSPATIVNMDCVTNITNTIFFIGVFDSEGKYINAHNAKLMHPFCTFSTRAEALTDKDSTKIHILPLLTEEEAKLAFEGNQDIICYSEEELPMRKFSYPHGNIRNALSGTQNHFECFVRFLVEIIKNDLAGSDDQITKLLEEKTPEAITKLMSVQCQTNWNQCATKILVNTQKLLFVKEGFRKKKPIMYTEYGNPVPKRQLPPNFLNIYNMKIEGRGFLAKLFYNYRNVCRMVNKIDQYKVGN